MEPLVQEIERRHAELETELGDPAVLADARSALPGIEEELRLAMVERDPADGKDVIVELRAGTGGDEAALFAGDLFQMLTRFAEQHGFKTETLTSSGGDAGGFKELV